MKAFGVSMLRKQLWLMATALLSLTVLSAQQSWTSKYVQPKSDGTLQYTTDTRGNIIPDFSGVGYKKNRKSLPDVPVVKIVEPVGEEQQQLIQSAIDEVAGMPIHSDGFRGTILLKKGVYRLPETIRIRTSGIVLRGEGNETILMATGKKQYNLISVSGTGDIRETKNTRTSITDAYVPVGTFSFAIANPEWYRVGDSIIVYRPGTEKWIADIQMNKIDVRDSTTVQWKAVEYGLHYERVITRIDGNRIFIDNPVVMAMEEMYGGGEIYKYSYPGRIEHVGVEQLLLVSEYKGDEDELHGWNAIHINRVVNGWVKQVTAKHFGYACVNLGYQARNITVTNCTYLQPKSKITGSRRYSFNNDGQLNLFMNCSASEGRHDYITGAKVCGPNVFYNCTAEKANADIGPHHRWATGTLYDNIVTDGELNIQDRGNWGTGHGWAGANQVVWNSTAAKVVIQSPWTSAVNYAIGVKGNKLEGRLNARPDGIWEGHNQSGLIPSSLYMTQLMIAKSKENR
jgi:hypothetical protein